jgi:hypothetical protein
VAHLFFGGSYRPESKTIVVSASVKSARDQFLVDLAKLRLDGIYALQDDRWGGVAGRHNKGTRGHETTLHSGAASHDGCGVGTAINHV